MMRVVYWRVVYIGVLYALNNGVHRSLYEEI